MYQFIAFLSYCTYLLNTSVQSTINCIIFDNHFVILLLVQTETGFLMTSLLWREGEGGVKTFMTKCRRSGGQQT
jgi:hypothetical protein